MKQKLRGWTAGGLIAAAGWLVGCAQPSATPASAAASHQPHWSYDGESGPAHWGSLDPACATCGDGREQSPIDLGLSTKQDLPNLACHYQATSIHILHNGHTVQVNADSGSFLELDGQRFDLLQFHFHTPSEHSVGGKSFAGELHLVHKNAAGELAVIGILLAEGESNATLESVLARLPTHETAVNTVPGSVNLAQLPPTDGRTYRYRGSLTTPPCSEGVRWSVFLTPISLSAQQLEALTAAMGRNNRPVQSVGARQVVEDSTP